MISQEVEIDGEVLSFGAPKKARNINWWIKRKKRIRLVLRDLRKTTSDEARTKSWQWNRGTRESIWRTIFFVLGGQVARLLKK